MCRTSAPRSRIFAALGGVEIVAERVGEPVDVFEHVVRGAVELFGAAGARDPERPRKDLVVASEHGGEGSAAIRPPQY